MCGIFGRIDFSGLPWAPQDDFRKIMNHRGPDDFGTIIHNKDDVQVTLTHNRLSIIDLSNRGRQPISNEDDSIWITFNGEIYNYQELQQELVKKGHRFKSNTDTEVLVHLYEEYGMDFIKKINGMFAFGIWDDKKKRLVLVRDRLGVKPLVYYADNKKCVFASEIKALTTASGVTSELSWEAVELFFTFNFIPAPWTINKSVRKLPPAHYLIFEKNKIKLKKYWSVSQKRKSITNLNEACVQIREIVSVATKDRLKSDVPLGAFLSGGIDSSVIVANIAKHYTGKLQTYFLGYKDDDLFDESKFARAVATMYDTEHHEIMISHNDIMGILPEVLSLFDEPFADSSAIPTGIVCREIKKFVTVALSGDGGDEIFGGYRRYLAEIYAKLYLKFPEMLRLNIFPALLDKIPDSKGNKWLEVVRRLKIFVKGVSLDKSDRHLSWMAMFPKEQRYQILSSNVLSNFRDVGKRHVKDIGEAFPHDGINQALYRDLCLLLPNDMLFKVDSMSMHNSLEVRSPLLDYRLAELGFQIPGNFKVRPTELKYVFRRAFKNSLPKELWNRRKQGFEIPIGEWFKRKDSLRRTFWAVVNDNKNYFNLQGVEQIMSEHLANRRDHSHKLWAILVFGWWLSGDYGIKN